MEKIAQLLSILYTEGGFYGGTLFYLAVCFIISYSLIKRRYNDVFICDALKDDYDELLEKGQGSKIGEILVANGYTVLGHAFVAAAKIVFSLIYIFTLKTETLSYVDSAVFNFPIFLSPLQILKQGGVKIVMIFAVVLLIGWAEYVTNVIIGSKCFVDSVAADTGISAAVCISAILLPSGYAFFLLLFSLAELIATVLCVGPLKRRAKAGAMRSMSKFNARYKAKVVNERKDEPVKPVSKVHPKKKKK